MQGRFRLVTYKLIYTKQANKDAKKISAGSLREQTEKLLEILQKDPYQDPPPYKKLIGDLNGAISRRINIQHRLVFQILEHEKIIKILRLWTHYE
jgi:Txe/YoeB family toxin of toxin-antitoxin system